MWPENRQESVRGHAKMAVSAKARAKEPPVPFLALSAGSHPTQANSTKLIYLWLTPFRRRERDPVCDTQALSHTSNDEWVQVSRFRWIIWLCLALQPLLPRKFPATGFPFVLLEMLVGGRGALRKQQQENKACRPHTQKVQSSADPDCTIREGFIPTALGSTFSINTYSFSN